MSWTGLNSAKNSAKRKLSQACGSLKNSTKGNDSDDIPKINRHKASEDETDKLANWSLYERGPIEIKTPDGYICKMALFNSRRKAVHNVNLQAVARPFAVIFRQLKQDLEGPAGADFKYAGEKFTHLLTRHFEKLSKGDFPEDTDAFCITFAMRTPNGVTFFQKLALPEKGRTRQVPRDTSTQEPSIPSLSPLKPPPPVETPPGYSSTDAGKHPLSPTRLNDWPSLQGNIWEWDRQQEFVPYKPITNKELREHLREQILQMPPPQHLTLENPIVPSVPLSSPTPSRAALINNPITPNNPLGSSTQQTSVPDLQSRIEDLLRRLDAPNCGPTERIRAEINKIQLEMTNMQLQLSRANQQSHPSMDKLKKCFNNAFPMPGLPPLPPLPPPPSMDELEECISNAFPMHGLPPPSSVALPRNSDDHISYIDNGSKEAPRPWPFPIPRDDTKRSSSFARLPPSGLRPLRPRRLLPRTRDYHISHIDIGSREAAPPREIPFIPRDDPDTRFRYKGEVLRASKGGNGRSSTSTAAATTTTTTTSSPSSDGYESDPWEQPTPELVPADSEMLDVDDEMVLEAK